jgi:hypothetical protein
MIANGTAPAVDYGIERREDGRFEIVWTTAPITGEVEAEIATAATAAEDGHYSTNPRLSSRGGRSPRGSATAPASIPPAAGSALPDRRRPLVMCRLYE